MSWRWPRPQRRRIERRWIPSALRLGLGIGLGVGLAGCGEALRQPDLSGPDQQEAEQAMPELQLFDDPEGGGGPGQTGTGPAPLGSP